MSTPNNGKNTGPNSVPASILKNIILKKYNSYYDISAFICPPKQIFRKSYVPKDIQNDTSCTSIQKYEIRLFFNSYRPISFLSDISKIIEKLMHQRLYLFLDQILLQLTVWL